MPSIFRPLLMGSSNVYYIDMLKTMYMDVGDKPFEWRYFMNKYPNVIGKSELSRLKCSSYILKQKSNNKSEKIIKWKLNPEVKQVLQEKKVI